MKRYFLSVVLTVTSIWLGTSSARADTATVTLGNLTQTYGSYHAVTATTVPAGLDVTFTYDGSSTVPYQPGSYTVVATVNDATYTGTATGTLTLNKAPLTVIVDNVSKAYQEANPTLTVSYSGMVNGDTSPNAIGAPALSTTAVTSSPVGTYPITASVGSLQSSWYQFATFTPGTLTVNKATATVTLGGLTQNYSPGSPRLATATTYPVGRYVVFTYDGSDTAPFNAGSYTVVGTIDDANYMGAATGTMIVNKKAATTVTLNGLSQTYNGSTRVVTAATNPSGLNVTFTYDGSSTAPVNAGSYAVVGTVSDINYSGTKTGTLVIAKAAATVTLGSLSATYDGSPKTATATTSPAGMDVTFTYNGSSTPPTNGGSYTVVGTINNINYSGTKTGTLIINKAAATVTLGNLSATYDGSPKAATATTSPSGLTVTFKYNGSSTSPTNQGTYTVVGTISDTNYQGTATGTLTIGPTSVVYLSNLSATYDGTAKTPTVTTVPAGLTAVVTYNGSSTLPVNAGSYAVVATVNDSGYSGTATGTMVIGKGAATVTLGNLSTMYDGSTKTATATTIPAGLSVGFTYNGSSTAPTNIGNYTVVGTINDSNYQGAASGTLVIDKAAAGVTLGSLSQTYNGSGRAATATTSPAGLTINFTYNGSSTAPTNVGSYMVVATINDAIYQGTATGTLTIAKATASVTLGSLTSTYNGLAHAATATTSPAGLTVTYTYNGSSTAPTNAGDYTVVGTINDANYAGSASATVTVNKAPLTVTADNKSRVYGAENPTFTATLSGFVNGETLGTSGVTGSAGVPTPPPLTTGVGTAAITPAIGTLAAGNYSFANFVNGTLTITKATLMVTADDQTRSYLAPDPTLTVTYSGFLNGDTAAVLSGAPALSTSAQAVTPAGSNASVYVSAGTLAAANYQFSFTAGKLTITKALLSVTLLPAYLSRTYDGSPLPVFATTTVGGLTFDYTYNGGNTPPTVVGTYAVVATINDINYQGTASGTLVVNKAAAALTINNLGQTYNGSPRTLTATTFPVGLSVNFTYDGSSTAPTAAGSYTVVATVNDDNYEKSLTGTLVVAKAAATVTLGNLSQTYNGSARTVTSNTSPAGLNVTYAYEGSSTAPTNAGNYGVVATINDANYMGSVTNTLVVNKATASIVLSGLSVTYDGGSKNVAATTAPAGLSVSYTYNGSALVPINAGSYTVVGTINDDNYAGTATDALVIAKATATIALVNLAQSYSGMAHTVTASTTPSGVSVACTYNGSSTAPIAVGSYTVVATINSPNYTGTPVSGTMIVDKATLTFSAANATRTYGAADPNFSIFTVGYVNGENASTSGVTGYPSVTTAATISSAPGSYPIIISVGTLSSANYKFSYSAGGNLVVTKAPLTVTAEDKSRVYGGANPTFTATLTGFVNGETLGTSGVTGTAWCTTTATASTGVGTAPITAAAGSLASSNYSFSSLVNGTLTITKAVLTVTADNKSRVYGAANPAFTATLTGFVNGETLGTSGVTGSAQLVTTATATTSVGTATITAAIGTLAASNYSFGPFVNGTLTITKAALTVTADNKSRVYGAANPAFTATLTGFVNGETLATSGVTGAAQPTTTATATTGVGTATITAAVGTLTSSNYSFGPLVNGTLTITKAPLTVTADNKSRVYGAPNPELTATLTGFANTETFATSGITGATQLATTATSVDGVGTAVITAAVGTLASSNYSFGSFIAGALTIIKAPLTITARNATRSVGAANPAFGASFTGLMNGDMPASVISPSYSTTAVLGSVVGSYAINVSGAASTANYTVTYVPGTLTIIGATPKAADAGGDWDKGILPQTRYGVGPDGVPLLNPHARDGVFSRGAGTDPQYHTMVVPLDFQKGVQLDLLGNSDATFGAATELDRPWFVRIDREVRYQVVMDGAGKPTWKNKTIDELRANPQGLPYENVVASFGSAGGGTPLLTGQHYRFGLYAGYAYANENNTLMVDIYRKSDFATPGNKTYIARKYIHIPSPGDSGSAWDDFARNGYMMSLDFAEDNHHLKTTIRYAEGSGLPLGTPSYTGTYVIPPGPLIFDHQSDSSEFVYRISLLGMVLYPDGPGAPTYGSMTKWWASSGDSSIYAINSYGYSLDFDDRGPWQSTFIHQPHFESVPAPSGYTAGNYSLSAIPNGTPVLADGSFEQPQLAAGQFASGPAVVSSAWTFKPVDAFGYLTAYLAQNGSAYNNPSAPDGSQVAILQRDGWIRQSVVFPSAGTYVLSLQVAKRSIDPSAKAVAFTVDGVAVDTIVPGDIAFQEYVTRTFTVEAGMRTLQLTGVDHDVDTSTFIDKVRIEAFVPMANSAAATPVNPSSYTELDHSPELRRHPILDKFVADMGNDPIALTNYVINEIEVTDALSYNQEGEVSSKSVNQGGVSRGALATYMEGQGSPWEQCALLVYLLRQAGVPAAYMEAGHDKLRMLDADISKVLRVQLSGAVNNVGALYGAQGDHLVAVNYPWVAAYVEGRWVHLFPWLKDTEVTEGYNPYDFLPSDYNSGRRWVNKYLQLDPAIHALGADDTVAELFPKFIAQSLKESAPTLSMDDMGVHYRNRRSNVSRWQDFRPAVQIQGRSVPLESLQTKTGIFDTVTVTVSSHSHPEKKIETGTLRLLDLHNRRLIVEATSLGGNNHTLGLRLAPFRPAAIGENQFTNDADLLVAQRKTTTLNSSDALIDIAIAHSRHINFPRNQAGSYGYWDRYLGQNFSPLDYTKTVQISKGDLAAICINDGRVTDRMLQTHAEDHWKLERQRGIDPSSVDGEEANRILTYLMGMTYYRNTSHFDEINTALHKRHIVSQFAVGLSKFFARRINGALPNDGEIILNQAGVDMYLREDGAVSNGTIHADSAVPFGVNVMDYLPVWITASSAEEHNTIRNFFGDDGAISTVRLLKLSQQDGHGGMIWLTKDNYYAAGNVLYTVDGVTKALKDWDPGVWSSLSSAFGDITLRDFTYAYITPGPMVSSGHAYKGMGALIYGQSLGQALISGNMAGLANGGFGGVPIEQYISGYGTVVWVNGHIALIRLEPYNVNEKPVTNIAPANTNPNDMFVYLDRFDHDKAYVLTKAQAKQLALMRTRNPGISLVDALKRSADKGDLSDPSFLKRTWSMVSDPVNSTTGEFYQDNIDLRLDGPMPLEVRRSYSSKQLASNEFGYGWLFGYNPYLTITDDQSIIQAADADGSVVAYSRQGTADVWMPSFTSNPDASNLTGGVTNLYNARIVRSVEGANTLYTLSTASGATRIYRIRQFPVTGMTRERPYLDKWSDNRGNYHLFTYGTDSMANDYGKIARIQSSNGNAVNFAYDVYGHILEAFTVDGRLVRYTYDDSGNLTEVKLPDGSIHRYEYGTEMTSVPVFDEAGYMAANGDTVTDWLYESHWETHQGPDGNEVTEEVRNHPDATPLDHYNAVGRMVGLDPGGRTDVPTSSHLIVRESKPDGRILENTYDADRRVTQQKATVGTDLKPVVNATFDYSETGKTKIRDAYYSVTHKETVYEYADGLVHKVTDELGRTIETNWYSITDTTDGAYPRSVKNVRDKRGLFSEYKYDSHGNVKELKVTGDLDGDPATAAQTVTTTSVYNARNQPVSVTDPAGITTQFYYTNTDYPFLPTSVVTLKGSVQLREDKMEYGARSSATTPGTLFSRGLLVRKYAAFGTSDVAQTDFDYSPAGFLSQQTGYTGTTDPSVVVNYAYNLRGELVESRDGDDRRTVYSYDAMGRTTVKDVRDETGRTLGLWRTYYNGNGEMAWVDGPRSGPEDWVRRNYDGAGRIKEELTWRSQAKADGSGVEAPSGDAQFARTTYVHDLFGNLVASISPRGHAIAMTYDEIGQLKTRSYFASTNTAGTPLRTESFEYEPGGGLAQHTNPLGGVTKKFYTSTGQLRRQENPDDSAQEWRYYPDGRLQKEILRNGSYWETTYDEVARTVTRTLKSSAGSTLATEVTVSDRRGNIVSRTDAEGKTFGTTYDGLNRPRITIGPAATSTTGQQVSTTYYGASAKTFVVVNGALERSTTTTDALSRTVRSETKDASGTVVHVTAYGYSDDHNAITVTEGTGAGAIVSTVYTDTSGRPLLSRFADGKFVLNRYDLAGNLLSSTDEMGRTTRHAYDALGQLKQDELSDGTTTVYAYDAAGNRISRAMANGQLLSSAVFDNAGRMTSAKLQPAYGAAATRQFGYSYYPVGNIWAGLPWQTTDPRGTVFTTTYDAFLRPYTVTSDGTGSETDQTTTYLYDKRGLPLSITQISADSVACPSTVVTRGYDDYGQIIDEQTTIAGVLKTHLTQTWDAAGRRHSLDKGAGITSLGSGAGISRIFGYRADGALGNVTVGGQSFDFGYQDNGLLSSRSGAGWAFAVQSRDARGRITGAATTVSGGTPLIESLGWRDDSKITSYSIQRQGAGTWNESRAYSYTDRGQLAAESYVNAVGASQSLTYQFDGNTTGGLGVRTSAYRDASWRVTGNAINDFGRTIEESLNGAPRTILTAGTAPGASSVYLRLDGAKIPWVDFNPADSVGTWSAVVDLKPRSYSLTAIASTGTMGPQTFEVTPQPVTVTSKYDDNGNVTDRLYSDGKTQVLKWDGLGRLIRMTQRDAFNAGFTWSAVYDGLGRRLQTTYQSVRAGANAGDALTTGSWYDPQVEFLEIAATVSGERVWKVYGPDLNGRYGSLQGTGGLEATVIESSGTTKGVINDLSGNGVASVSAGVVSWFNTRVSAYGPLPESWAEPFTEPARLAEATAWRGRRIDPTGFYYLGARYYDPTAGRFISPDPMGHGASMSLYDFANGDPVNYFDPDGRFGKAFGSEAYDLGETLDNGLGEFYNTGQDFFTAGMSLYMQGDIPPDLMFSSQVFNASDSVNVNYLGIDFNANALVGTAQAATFGATNAVSGGYNLATGDFKAAQSDFTAAFLGLAGAKLGADAQGMKTGMFYLSEANAPAAVAAGMRAQILANINESRAARAASNFGQSAAESVPGKFSVGIYGDIRGTVSGLDAHHVGQKAVMEKLIPGYDPATAPSILVRKVGHTIRGPNGIVSRSTEGFTSARDVIARDIMELRRVYPDVPNSKLQELIQLNKDLYPSVRK
ncbi:MAG: hypothetical protein JSS11_08320 [Verrucomicrobia bacterium]|nr:hypothetical protein [Verrucomicrobiota bacterium]